jgi:hypothetical protein
VFFALDVLQDGPMLELLKSLHRSQPSIPMQRGNRPDPDRLARRFERFQLAN